MDLIVFAIYLAACLGAGATGAAFPPGDWYRALTKPPWNPPDWVFPVTWMVLYLCIAGAAARVSGQLGAEIALALWAVQIALNALWTPVFFGLHNIRGGAIVVSILWVTVAACMIALWSVDTIAGLLFVPYLIWVTIASALNLTILKLNPAS